MEWGQDVYVVLNWALTLAGASWLAWLYIRERHQFVRPSVLLFAFAHLFFQWPLAVLSGAGDLYTWLPRPYDLVLLVHGFVLAGLAGTRVFGRAQAGALWHRLESLSGESGPWGEMRSLGALSVIAVALVGAYLSYVPFDCTGLYALITAPALATTVREMSLKLLPDAAPRYAFSFFISAVALLLAARLTLLQLAGFRARRWGLLAVTSAGWLLCALAVLLQGAKGNLVYLILASLAAGLWISRLKISGMTVLSAFGAVVVSAGIVWLISYSSMGNKSFDAKDHFVQCGTRTGAPAAVIDEDMQRMQIYISSVKEKALARAIPSPEGAISVPEGAIPAQMFLRSLQATAWRAFVGPFWVGTWYVHHAQTEGPVGVAGIRRLADWLGVPAVNLPNLIGRKYTENDLSTISAGAGYPFVWYAYFGLAGGLFAAAAAWLLDILVLALFHIEEVMLVPALSALSVATLKFIEADYTVVWVSHGILVILAVSWVCGILARIGSPGRLG